MKNETNDTITRVIIKIIDVMFLNNIERTCYGFLCGTLLLSLQDFISTFFPLFGLIKWYGFICFGIMIFNLNPFIKKKYANPKIESIMNYTKEVIEEGNFSSREKKEIWKNVVTLIINNYLNNIGQSDQTEAVNNNITE